MSTTTQRGHHRVSLERTLERGRPTFTGRCSCGAQSSRYSTSGMVAGWTGTHRDRAELGRVS
jgi:hypothetical protein